VFFISVTTISTLKVKWIYCTSSLFLKFSLLFEKKNFCCWKGWEMFLTRYEFSQENRKTILTFFLSFFFLTFWGDATIATFQQVGKRNFVRKKVSLTFEKTHRKRLISNVPFYFFSWFGFFLFFHPWKAAEKTKRERSKKVREMPWLERQRNEVIYAN
jgi:hypothetical protein